MENEILYNDTLKLQKQGKVNISETFADALGNKGQKIQSSNSSHLSGKYQQKVKLTETDRVVIRKAEKYK